MLAVKHSPVSALQTGGQGRSRKELLSSGGARFKLLIVGEEMQQSAMFVLCCRNLNNGRKCPS